MAEKDTPTRSSNMEKAEGDRDTLINRHPYGNNPTKLDEERTASDGSTVSTLWPTPGTTSRCPCGNCETTAAA